MTLPALFHRLPLPGLLACACLAGLTACASPDPALPDGLPPPVLTTSTGGRPAPAPLWLWALTDDERLLRLRADAPQQITAQLQVRGLAAGDKLVGIDYRVARGVLYALSRAGRLYTVNTDTGQLSPVGEQAMGWPLLGAHVGVDFNPVADRVRVVTEAGQNLRLHPDTGLLVDFDAQAPGPQPDGALAYGAGDVNAGKTPRIVAAGYTYNKDNDKLTTNYAIDLGLGVLVMQGSHESKTPPVSPNTGRLMTVGPLGVPGLKAADLDISDLGNLPLAVLRTDRTRLYRLNLTTGAAELIGLVGNGAPLRAIAIEP